MNEELPGYLLSLRCSTGVSAGALAAVGFSDIGTLAGTTDAGLTK